MTTPIEQIANRQVGIVDFISSSEIEVNLDLESPHSIAMGTGQPQLFPRLNGFLLISCESGFLVGKIGSLSIKPSPYPKRKGIQDFGILDLPFPSRKLKLNLLGILKIKESAEEKVECYEFKRGVHSFPSLGDAVLLPDKDQLRAIIESGTRGKIKIGTYPLADNADVKIDADRLFGRHLAVLGNTGSGKSCTVSGLIKWSLEEAKKQLTANNDKPNARFIILDPNGEYSKTFSGFEPNIFKVSPHENYEKQLKVPSWFWNSHEWSSITQASGKTQKPLLSRSLTEIKNSIAPTDSVQEKALFRKRISFNITNLRISVQNQSVNSKATKIGKQLEAILSNLDEQKNKFLEWEDDLDRILETIKKVLNARKKSFVNKSGQSVEHYEAFNDAEINNIIENMNRFLQDKLGGILVQLKLSEDSPVPFDGKKLADHIEMLGQQENVSQFIDFLVMRIQTIFSNSRMSKIIKDVDIKLEDWLSSYIGGSGNKQHIAIIDLSLVPKEIIYLVAAVISRMTFEALQRYKNSNENRESLSTVLVMEEAHTFIKKYNKDSEDFSSSRLCTEIFEKIAREGRKFGLGLVLSSQRPSELSSTVLSQCNTFLLHRITNYRDQEIISRLVPDSLRGMIQELPALPSRHAYLLGWASEIPILTEMSYLEEKFRPKSDDPDFWKVWTKQEDRDVNWQDIVNRWQNIPSELESPSSDNS